MELYELKEWMRRDIESLLFTHLKTNGIVTPHKILQQDSVQKMLDDHVNQHIHKIETDYDLSIYLQIETMYNSIIGA